MINPFLGFKTCNHSSKTRSSGRPGSMPGFWVLTGLVLFFFKSKRRHFSKKQKKNKSQRVCNRVLPSQPGCRVNPPNQPGHIGFSLPLFFLQPGLVPAPGRPGPGSTCRAGFQNYAWNIGHPYLA